MSKCANENNPKLSLRKDRDQDHFYIALSLWSVSMLSVIWAYLSLPCWGCIIRTNLSYTRQLEIMNQICCSLQYSKAVSRRVFLILHLDCLLPECLFVHAARFAIQIWSYLRRATILKSAKPRTAACCFCCKCRNLFCFLLVLQLRWAYWWLHLTPAVIAFDSRQWLEISCSLTTWSQRCQTLLQVCWVQTCWFT